MKQQVLSESGGGGVEPASSKFMGGVATPPPTLSPLFGAPVSIQL